jgi:hypothetical protein
MRMNNTKEALTWIINLIKKYNIPFQIAGGLAVQAYGSTRKLMDIDIDIPEEDFKKIRKEIESFIIFGPEQFKDENWKIFLITLNYQGQEIDIGGAYKTKIYDKKTKCWKRIVTDYSKVEYKNIYGLILPVIGRKELIAYKKILARPVDLLDIEYLENT